MQTPVRAIDEYKLLGRSGLRVSPLALGGGSFGDAWGWGADKAESRRIFDRYVDLGGNFIDTANVYNDGDSEAFLGEFMAAKRHRIVVATKYTNSTGRGDPNAGGSHRKSIVRAVELSLKRLRTDYIDIYMLHVWDQRTPIDELMRAQDDLVRAGKVLYIGASNTPAWLISQAQCLADRYGWTPLINLQIEYSLIQRTAELDLLPMAVAMGLGVAAWSPTAGGLLTGKYRNAARGMPATFVPGSTPTRRDMVLARMTERNVGIVSAVVTIAADIGCSPGQVALRWLLDRPIRCIPIVGCRTVLQLEENLRSLTVELSSEQILHLTAISEPARIVPYDTMNSELLADHITGGSKIDICAYAH